MKCVCMHVGITRQCCRHEHLRARACDHVCLSVATMCTCLSVCRYTCFSLYLSSYACAFVHTHMHDTMNPIGRLLLNTVYTFIHICLCLFISMQARACLCCFFCNIYGAGVCLHAFLLLHECRCMLYHMYVHSYIHIYMHMRRFCFKDLHTFIYRSTTFIESHTHSHIEVQRHSYTI
jgi:hypothetical protein